MVILCTGICCKVSTQIKAVAHVAARPSVLVTVKL